MNHKNEPLINEVKEAMQLARESAAIAHECWQLLIKSKKVLIKSLKEAGYSHLSAFSEFDKLMDDHSEKYSEALKALYRTEERVKALNVE